MKIDETDRKIIGLLQDDARQSNAAIARIIGVSEATIRRRIKIMVEDGTLSIRAVPNPAKFGLNTSAVIGIDVQPDMLDTVATALNNRDEVGFLGVSTGRYDLLAWTLVGNLDELREFLESFLAKVPGIRKTETLVLLDVKKRSLGRMA
jgi:Lrp/AsnC family transcriptional regulator for asnA, asnC and gidA